MGTPIPSNPTGNTCNTVQIPSGIHVSKFQRRVECRCLPQKLHNMILQVLTTQFESWLTHSIFDVLGGLKHTILRCFDDPIRCSIWAAMCKDEAVIGNVWSIKRVHQSGTWGTPQGVL